MEVEVMGTSVLTDTLSLEEVAKKWEVGTKTIENWTETVYLGFGVRLAKRGPFSLSDAALLDEVGKHISAKAPQYLAETGERGRIKATEFIAKCRRMMSESEKYHNVQDFQEEERSPDEYVSVGNATEDDALGEFGLVVREMKSETSALMHTIETWEDRQVEKVAEFIEDTPNRLAGKLAKRLSAGRTTRKSSSLQQAVAVAFQVTGNQAQALPSSK